MLKILLLKQFQSLRTYFLGQRTLQINLSSSLVCTYRTQETNFLGTFIRFLLNDHKQLNTASYHLAYSFFSKLSKLLNEIIITNDTF